MPQLSLYIDENTLKQIELAARIEHLSLSKWVVSKLKNTLNNSWPNNFDNLFGAIQDDTFKIPKQLNFKDDTPMEEL